VSKLKTACEEPFDRFMWLCSAFKRFDPQLAKLHETIRSGKVGQIRYIHQANMDPISQMSELFLKKSGESDNQNSILNTGNIL